MGNRVSKRKSPARYRMLFLLALALVAASLLLYFFTPPAQSDVPPTGPTQPAENADDPSGSGDAHEAGKKKKGFYTILLVGTMDDYNTDTIMLISVDSENDKANVVSIPRDTMIDVPDKNKKINGVYGQHNIDRLMVEVYRLTGIYPDFYCLLRIESFIQIVDLVDGVEFDVPYDMYHPDKDQKYSINLKAGVQTLDGKKALQLVRYRGTSSSDLGRQAVQRDFLLATLKKVKSSFSLAQIGDMISIMTESVKTNMPAKDALWFYTHAVSGMDLDEDIVFDMMPVGGFGDYQKYDYVYLDKEKSIELINRLLNPYNTPITADMVNIIRLED